MKTEMKKEDISHDDVLQQLRKIWYNKAAYLHHMYTHNRSKMKTEIKKD
jgi:hypothetical protein